MATHSVVLVLVTVFSICSAITLDQLFPYTLQLGDTPLLEGRVGPFLAKSSGI